MHFLQLVFADLYGAMRSNEHYWAPQSPIWDAAWGWPELYLSQNMGLLYGGALTFAVILAFGLVRGLAWTREIRFFGIAAVIILLYTLGGYTPAFRLMYELLPGVSLFRRPADGIFVLGALLAVLAGYLVHRWLQGTVPPSFRPPRLLMSWLDDPADTRDYYRNPVQVNDPYPFPELEKEIQVRFHIGGRPMLESGLLFFQS